MTTWNETTEPDEAQMIGQPYYLDAVSKIERSERIKSTDRHFAAPPHDDEVARVAASIGVPIDRLIAREVSAHNDGGWTLFVKTEA